MCMGQEHIGQGWHSGATVGVFSAAAGAARGLRLDAEQTVHALGIAGTQSAGLMAAQYGAMVKRMHAGRAAQSGLYGALLAKDGFTGIVDVFEAPYGGFCTTFSRSHDRFNLDELSAGLGERFETMRIALKFYSCVGSNHTTLDAIRDIRTRRPFTLDEHRRDRRARLAGDRRSRRLAVPAGRPDLGAAQPAVLRRHAACSKATCSSTSSPPAASTTRAHRTLAQGRRWCTIPPSPRSAPALGTRCASRCISATARSKARPARRRAAASSRSPAPTTSSAKFRKLTRGVMPATQQDALVDAVLGLEKLPDSLTLIERLRVGNKE